MTYQRVMPRDLFNEGNLLKCYGQLWLKLENLVEGVTLAHSGPPHFNIQQDPSDGSLSIYNVFLVKNTSTYRLCRPLNSRDPWPLYCVDPDKQEAYQVFDDQGELSDEFVKFLLEE